MKIVAAYTLFAFLATAVNIGVQELAVRAYGGPYSLAASIGAGTMAGLLCKYLLDKRYIFRFETEGLVHDGRIVVDSSVICEYLDDVFPEPALSPADAHDRARMRARLSKVRARARAQYGRKNLHPSAASFALALSSRAPIPSKNCPAWRSCSATSRQNVCQCIPFGFGPCPCATPGIQPSRRLILSARRALRSPGCSRVLG